MIIASDRSGWSRVCIRIADTVYLNEHRTTMKGRKQWMVEHIERMYS